MKLEGLTKKMWRFLREREEKEPFLRIKKTSPFEPFPEIPLPKGHTVKDNNHFENLLKQCDLIKELENKVKKAAMALEATKCIKRTQHTLNINSKRKNNCPPEDSDSENEVAMGLEATKCNKRTRYTLNNNSKRKKNCQLEDSDSEDDKSFGRKDKVGSDFEEFMDFEEMSSELPKRRTRNRSHGEGTIF